MLTLVIHGRRQKVLKLSGIFQRAWVISIKGDVAQGSFGDLKGQFIYKNSVNTVRELHRFVSYTRSRGSCHGE